MFKKRFLSAAVCGLIISAVTLRADTVVLKSGEKVEGKLLNETDTELTISVQISPTIKDERVIKKTDIDRVEKVMPDEQAWAQMSGVMPGKDSLENSEYDRVTAMFTYFLTNFPKSPHAKAAQERLDSFRADQRRVEAGDVKMDGEWLSKDKVREERVQIGGHVLYNRMKAFSAAGNSIEAMRVFDQIEKNYGGSASYPDAVLLAKSVLLGLRPVVDQMQARMKQKVETDKMRLANAKGQEKIQLGAMLKRELTTAEAAVAFAERDGTKWLPLQPSTDRSLTSLASRITSELTRLNALPVEKMQDSIRSAQSAMGNFANRNYAATEKDLTEATAAWPKNEMAERLKKALAEAKKAPAPVAAPAVAPAPAEAPKAPAAPTPKPKPTPAPRAAEPAPVAVAPAPAPEPEPDPFYKKPIFFVGLFALAAFGSLAVKLIGKFRATEENS